MAEPAYTLRPKGLAQPRLTVGPLTVNLGSREVLVSGRPVHLTGKEYAILELLTLRKGVVLTKEAFLNRLYGGMDEPEVKIIDTFVSKLRKKLADAGADDLIGTVLGQGYVMRDPQQLAAALDVRYFIDEDGLVSPKTVTAILNVTQPQLAEAAGLSRDAVSKLARIRSRATQRRLRDMVEIVARVAPWAGGTQQALAWYRATPIPALGDQTAGAMVKAGHAAAVRAYLDGIAAGAYA